jgi:nicotinamide riboside kinase
MHDIWHGQYAVELNAYQHATDKRFIIRDTDLFSTIGYWEQPHWESELGEVPDGLISQARTNKADLYIITSSNIPFEADPLRYGGDHRESPDEYWISVAEKYGLNYVVLTDTTRPGRLAAARSAAVEAFLKKNQALMYYTRKGQ